MSGRTAGRAAEEAFASTGFVEPNRTRAGDFPGREVSLQGNVAVDTCLHPPALAPRAVRAGVDRRTSPEAGSWRVAQPVLRREPTHEEEECAFTHG